MPRGPEGELLLPTTTEPSSETAFALLKKVAPPSPPRPTIPPLVQRNASRPPAADCFPSAEVGHSGKLEAKFDAALATALIDLVQREKKKLRSEE